MAVDSESQFCGIHKQSRAELGCPLMILKSENKGMQKRAKWRLDTHKMTIDSENEVCRMYKKSRMELGCANMTVEN